MSAAEGSIPFAQPEAVRQISRTWEAFLSSGELSGPGLRPIIAERWHASRRRGLDPLLQRAPSALTSLEARTILDREDLGRAGRPVLEEFGRVVEGTGHVIVLADREGRVLHASGHAEVQRTLEQVNLAPGGLWSEDAVGPNGIGTPIAVGRPEIVFGPEHYCQGFQPFYCCGSPIVDPTSGSILGAVDITGPASKAQPMAFALTLSVARAVERNLTVLGVERRSALLKSFRGLERNHPSQALLLLDGSRRIVDINGAAADLLGLTSVPVESGLDEVVPVLVGAVRHAHESASCHEETLSLRVGSAPARTVVCRIEPVVVEKRTIGSVVVFSGRSTGVAASRVDRARTTAAREAPAAAPKYTFAHVIGTSPALREVVRLARAVASARFPKRVLIVGETGTGKEMIAHAIHAASERAERPFVVVNCSALPLDLVESELFGYAPGAFTGARREGQAGKFEAAQGGTVFLDEIDSMPLDAQAKLLRVIETEEVVRLGSSSPIALDVAIMAASGPDPRSRVEEGSFRLDLFHRLSVMEIVVPPLRERREDLHLLLMTFLDRECAQAARPPLRLSPAVIDRLMAYSWPGNVREVQNVCARWAITVAGEDVGLGDVPPHMRETSPAGAAAGADGLREREDAIIRKALAEAGGRVGEAARRLSINKTTIYRRMKRWGSA